jgi:hypothetical protein
MFINQSIPMEIQTPQDVATDPNVERMDAATQELSNFISYLCEKYGAEFIVQRVIFTFIPRGEAPAAPQESEA